MSCASFYSHIPGTDGVSTGICEIKLSGFEECLAAQVCNYGLLSNKSHDQCLSRTY